MSPVVTVLAIAAVVAILWDVFETIVLPRRVSRRVRIARVFYDATWTPWLAVARRLRRNGGRENLLSLYGPLSLLGLFGVWGAALVVAFAGLHWGLGTQVQSPEAAPDFLTDLYVSGTTFFTLGLGDVTPRSAPERAVTVVEVAIGFGFLALVISYLPVLYQAFASREAHVSMLDQRAGSPPSAIGMLRRHVDDEDREALGRWLVDWERWAAELMESHLTYPVLGYFRSQHDNQSWVASLTVVLDACALMLVGLDGIPRLQARFAFAMARHAAADLSQILGLKPRLSETDRLPPVRLAEVRAALAEIEAPLREGLDADRELAELRVLYEPYVHALSAHLLMDLPPWLPPEDEHDNWQTTAWGVARLSLIRKSEKVLRRPATRRAPARQVSGAPTSDSGVGAP